MRTRVARAAKFIRYRGPIILPFGSLVSTMATYDTSTFYSTGTYTGGVVQFPVPTTTGGGYTAYLDTIANYNLTNSSVAVEVPTVPNVGNGGTEAYVTVRASTGNELRFRWGNNQFSAQEVINNTATTVGTAVTYNATNHRWWRIRSVGSTIYWEYRSASGTYTTLASKTTTLPITSMQFAASSGAYQTETAGGYLAIDNLNNEVVAAVSRPYFAAADWLWTPIPASPVLHANSTTWAGYFGASGTQHGASVYDFGAVVITPDQVTASTPRYTVPLSDAASWGDPYPNMTIPIPDNTRIAPMTTTYGDTGDAHICIADPINNRVFSLWRATPQLNPRQAEYGGLAALDGDGIETAGSSTATNISLYCSIVRIAEIQAAIAAGTGLSRAIIVTTDMANTTFVYPAQKSDGTNAGGVATPISEGMRLQLNPSASLSGITNPVQLVIARTLQTYGAYIGDRGGSRIGIVMEFEGDGNNPGAQWSSWGVTDYYEMSQIPWGQLRVLNFWNGS